MTFRSFLHDLAHAFGVTSDMIVHVRQDDGCLYLGMQCQACGRIERLAHSIACECHESSDLDVEVYMLEHAA